VRIADAQRVRVLAPLACKTERIDAPVLTDLARRRSGAEGWLPDPPVPRRARTASLLPSPDHAQHDAQDPRQPDARRARAGPSDAASIRARRPHAARRPTRARPVARNLRANTVLIESLEEQISEFECELRTLGADHQYVPRADDRARDRADTRVHDRRRDWRHHSLPDATQAHRLHRRPCALCGLGTLGTGI
jgi:transposase